MNEPCKTANGIKPFIQTRWELFTVFLLEISSCEEVCFYEFKNMLKNKKTARSDGLLISRKTYAQAVGLDFAAFFIFAAAFLRLM